MGQRENIRKSSSDYESLHAAVIVNDRLKPSRIIIPACVIITIIAVLSIYTNIQKQNIIEKTEQVTNQMAEFIAGSISNEIGFAKASIKLASTTISQSMTSDTLENPTEIITPMVANTPFNGLEFIRPDGMNIVNIGKPFDASDRIYYIEGIKGNTGVWNNFHPKTSQETLMNFYTPIMYQGKVSGVLTGYIAATSQIAPMFKTDLYGQEIHGLLVDENDMVICSTFKSDYIKDLSLDILLDRIGATEEQISTTHSAIDNATEDATSYKEPNSEGRLCVATIPGTEWKVVVLVPGDSFNAIVGLNIRDSIITVFIIGSILILYASFTLLRNVKRQKEIAKENAALEEENRIFNEENIRAFKEISAIRDINASANMGTWRIELVEGKDPRMFVDDTMKSLLGILDKESTPEETYSDWFSKIAPEAIPSVLQSVEKMKQGNFNENTYLWNHPSKGQRYVRCGGSAQEIHGGYLLSGYHYDVDEVVREDLAQFAMLQDALNEKTDYYNTLGTLAGIYNSMHVLNLIEDTVVEFSAADEHKDIVDLKQGAAQRIAQYMTELATDECRERALEYTDLTTLADRMQNRNYIATQLIGNRIGWFLASFIAMETDSDGRPTRVIFTTQSIDEEKKQEEKLIRTSRTDELTGLLNRHAYEEDIYEHGDLLANDHIILMSLDVNSLKVVNDTLGHTAGDELLVGACQCMKRSLGPYGRLYRTGGDEFIAILYCDNDKLKEVLLDFERTMASWSGKLVDSLTISYGFVSNEEEPGLSVKELGAIADKRMYEAKSEHYRKTGMDRDGRPDAYGALCALYTKVLKINISDDTYQVIDMDMTEQTAEKGFSERLSSWLTSFGTSGQIHPDDLQEYLDKTDIRFMREYFSENSTPLVITYRRRYGSGFEPAEMEIVPAHNSDDANQDLYLYVKHLG